MTINDIISDIYACAPLGGPEPREARTIRRLRSLTGALVAAYDAAGFLDQHPFSEVLDRRIHRASVELTAQLANSIVLVTGGEGAVGRHLLASLSQFSPRQLVSVDIVPPDSTPPSRWKYHQVNIAEFEPLQKVFRRHRPTLVFHLAASREPARAEREVKAAVVSNVIGTRNIFRLCAKFGVVQCVHASSGKAARYYTPDVYAASKKLAEWQLAHAARDCMCVFTVVRFTHIAENSIVEREMNEKITSGLVSFHSHDRFLLLQNMHEAVTLLMNALVLGRASEPSILTARNLGWPVEVLRLPLYLMKSRGVIAPIWFRGVPRGYESDLFRGQLDWTRLAEFGPMINAQEVPRATNDPTGDMTIAPLASFSTRALEDVLARLQDVVEDHGSSDDDVRAALAAGIARISRSSLERAPVKLVWRILQAGIDTRVQSAEAILAAHTPTITLLAQAVVCRTTTSHLETIDAMPPTLQEIVSLLSRIDGLDGLVDQLQAICDNAAYD